MMLLKRVIAGFRGLYRKNEVEQELDAELRELLEIERSRTSSLCMRRCCQRGWRSSVPMRKPVGWSSPAPTRRRWVGEARWVGEVREVREDQSGILLTRPTHLPDPPGLYCPAVDVFTACGFSVSFCTRQFRSSATYSSFSDGQAISWIQPNCFAW
jgi:hypothetical protein